MNNPTNRSPLVVSLTFLLIGGIFLTIGLGMATWTIMWAAGGTQSTEGTVVKMVRGGKGTKPVVQYEVAGQNHEVEGLLTTTPPAYRVGDKVQVLYKSASPVHAMIDTFTNRWLFPTIFGGIGGVFALVGAIVFAVRFCRGT